MSKKKVGDSNFSDLLALLRLSLIIPVLLFGCNERAADTPGTQTEPSFLEINDVQVPVFSTAEEQLNYTRSWFAEIRERRAALQAFLEIYPEEKRFCGLVSLDLAYLEICGDYRFAYDYACFAAIKAYMNILDNYSEFPEIMAKAHWYIGWIYSDLLGEYKKGIVEFKKIVTRYPQEDVTLLPPAPWVSIIYQNDENVRMALSKRSANSWGALALVEIIRHAGDEEIGWSAFQQLWRDYRHNVAAGFGLRLVLQKRYHTGETIEMAREYMEKEFSNVHLLGDIQKEINEISALQGGILK